MATFKDANNRTWNFQLDAPTIVHVREETEKQLGKMIDLADEEGKAYDKLVGDPLTLVTVIYLVLEEQIKAQDLSERDFARGVVGDAIENATKALLKAIVDFFPQRGRDVLNAVAAKQDKLRNVAHARAMQVLTDPEIDRKLEAKLHETMDDAIAEALTPLNSATATPASSTVGTSAE